LICGSSTQLYGGNSAGRSDGNLNHGASLKASPVLLSHQSSIGFLFLGLFSPLEVISSSFTGFGEGSVGDFGSSDSMSKSPGPRSGFGV
jgi:hypothetical protein